LKPSRSCRHKQRCKGCNRWADHTRILVAHDAAAQTPALSSYVGLKYRSLDYKEKKKYREIRQYPA
jgi:hypothetical protein